MTKENIILIQILSITVETKPTAKGSYQMAEIAFKNLSFQGKVESKKLMSFGATAPAFSALSKAEGGSKWDITVVKNDRGYNDWTSATPSTGDAPAAQAAPTYAPSNPNRGSNTTTVKSTYETSEERAAKQVYIVKQSSLSAAINLLSVGSKTPPKTSDVLTTAQEFVDFVFGKTAETGSINEAQASGSGFDDMSDDVPY